MSTALPVQSCGISGGEFRKLRATHSNVILVLEIRHAKSNSTPALVEWYKSSDRHQKVTGSIPVGAISHVTGTGGTVPVRIDLDQIDKFSSDTVSLRTIQYGGPCSM